MSPAPTVLVIQPDEDDQLERFEVWLTAAGVGLHTVRPYQEPLPSTSDADGLIVLGGRMSATDDHEHPWLEQIRELMRAFAARERPVLGICLGGQLLAQALGGEVTAPGGAGVEAGLVRLTVTDEAADDPLAGGLGDSFLSTSLHQDAISRLPDGARLLAGSGQYPHQMFRLGRCWGLQFHPEASPDTYAGWAGGFTAPTPQDGERVLAGIANLRAHAADVEAAGHRLAEAFATLLPAV